MSMTNSTNHVEIISSVQRRRRWTAPEKVRMVEETFEPGMTVSLVARRHGVAPNQLFTWRRLVAQGSLTAAGSGEEVVPASEYRALQNQVRGQAFKRLGHYLMICIKSDLIWSPGCGALATIRQFFLFGLFCALLTHLNLTNY